MRVPSARNIAAKLAVFQVVLLATSLIGPALGVVPFKLPIAEVRAAAGTGLDLNGTNQHVTFGVAPGLGATAFTLEIWFKRTGNGVGTGTGTGGIASAIPLLTKGRAEADAPANLNVNYFLGIDAATGVLVADFEDTVNGGNHPVTASTVVTSDVWHHAAATYSGSTWNIYLDGVLDRTLNLGTAFLPQSASIQHAALGTAIGSSASFPAAGFLDGEIDEARVWNQARSLAQIQTSKDVEIGDDPALLGLWHLNEGTGTTTADSSNSGHTGTLVNAPTWPEGFTPPVLPTANGLELRQVATPATVTNATYVAFGDPAELDLAQFTIETWFRRTGAGTAGSTGTGGIASFLPLVTHGGPQAEGSNVDANWLLGIDDATDVIAADFETMADGANQPVRGTSVIAMNTWYHVAATYDGTNWRLYLNGQLEATQSAPPPRSDTIQHAALGVSLNSTGAINAGNLARFHGTLDEVRVWNAARSLAQIRAEINSELSSAPAGLVARWPMTEASGINVSDTATAAASNGTIAGSPVARVAGAPFNLAFPEPPNAPALVAPANAATGVVRPPTLDVIASDPNGGTVNVQFFGRPLASGNYASLGAPQAIASGAHAIHSWTGLGGGQTYQWFATVNDGTTTTTGPTWTFHTAAETSGTVVAAIGDLATCTETGDTETAAIMAGIDGPIITTGDNVYETGTAAEFAACYEPTWGPFKARTRPVPGNHDWGNGVRTPASLTDYFAYFGANANAGGTSYYSYDLDANWHVVNLDSECANVPGGGCVAGSDQHDWLVADLAANASKNVIAVWHKPRFSSGSTNLVAMSDLVASLYAAGVDIGLVGHDHIYEVFQPLDPAGNFDPAFGIRHMTVGTGGAEHHAAGVQKPTSIALNDDTYGVTRLVLHPTSYEWRFFPVAGATFTDSGTGTVHGAPTPGDNGLDLGVGGSYVTFGDPAKLDLPTFTIETWFMRTGAGVANSTGTSGIAQFIPLVTHGGPESDGSNVDANWLLGINDATDVLAADFEDTATGLNHPISGSTPIANDVWHHAAATYDGTTWRLYLDGQLEATEVEGAFTPRSDTTQVAGLGVMLMTNGNPGNTARFQGVLDEARVWSGARSLAQIRSTINAEPTSGTNLVARWGMSEAAGTTVGDSIAPLADGSIIGSGSSRVAGAPFDISFDTTPPGAPAGLVATPGDGTVGLTWAANGEPDLAGYNVYRSTTSPVALTSPINGATLVASPAFVDNSVTNGTAYFYVVTAVDDSTNESTASNQATATPTGGPQQPTGLDLGSSGAYVTFGDPAKLDLSTFTIETWFKRTGAGVAAETGTSGIAQFLPLVTHGGPQTEGSNVDANWLLGINDATDVLAADFEDMATGLNHPISGTTPLVNGVWYHAAATYDGTTWRLYLNGRLEASEVENATPRSDTTQHAGLGVMLTTTGAPGNTARFQGVIDETRVWTGARNLSQIQSGVHQLPASTTGLVARWSMGEGSGTALDDGVAPDADGTITGAGTTWPAGAPFDIPTVSAGPNQNVTLPSSALLDGLALDDGLPSALTTTWSQITGPDSAAIANPNSQSTSVSFTGSGPGDYVFRLTAADGTNTIFDEITVTVIDPGPAPNFGLDFDGTNDYVTFGDSATLGLSQFTLETWFRRDGAGVPTQTGAGGLAAAIPLITKGRNEADGTAADMNYFLGIDNATGRLVADFEEGAAGTTPGLNHPVFADTVIQTGVWYHAAVTYSGTWRIYLNGVLDMTPVSVGQPLRPDSTQDAGLGTAMNSGGTPVGAFNGIMDEARIWNTIRSEAQIQAAMTGPLASAPGMVARWSMDEGAGGTIASSAGTTVNGTLNGPLFVAGTPFVSTANIPPSIPTNVAPTNGATGVSVNPTLQVGVSDPNGGTLTTSFYGRTAGSSAAEDFTFVVIPDTQHYVDSSNFLTFNQQTQWIVDNEDDLNIVFVSQLGDITENFDTVRQEFDRADAAMDTLDNAGIPNNLAPGNHDMSNPGAVTSDLWDEYFPPERYNLPVNPWYGGWLGEEAGQVQRLNKDNYELFTAGGIDFLIIHLEIDMPTYAVQWADEIIDRYPDRQVILSTHAFLNTSNARPSSRVTTRADGLSAAQVWTQLVAPNCNVFMFVNGHYPGEGRLTSTNSCGQPVHQVLTDYQSRPNGGDGWLRYYKFRPSLNTIEARTFSPKFGTFETDATSQFDLPYDMTALAGFDLIGTVETTSGSTASMPWPSRVPSTGYEWYAVTSDGIADRTSPTWTFTTTSGPSNSPPVVTAVPNQTNAEGAVIDLTVTANDAESDPLTYAATGLPAGLSMHPTTGHITGTIAFTAAAGSPYDVTVTADDPFNPPVPSTFTWTVTNVNREPTFDQDVLDQSHAEGAVISLDAGATDLDGDTLTYAATNLPPGLSISTTHGPDHRHHRVHRRRGQPVCRVGHRARRRHGRRHRRLQLGGQQRQRQPDVRPEPGQPDRCRERGHQPRRRWHRPRRRHPDLRRHQPAAGPQHQHQHGPDHRHHRLHRRRRQPVCRQHHGDRQPADGRRDRHVHVDRDQRQSRADVRPGRPQPDGSRRHPRQSRRWRHRSRRRHPDLRRHQPAAGPVDQHHHRAHHGDHRVHRLGHPVQRVGDGPRRGHGRRDGHLHVDRDQRQPRTDIRPGRARPEPCRGRRHQPRRGRHRSRRRHADLRRHQPAAGSVHQHQHGPDHRHHRVHRRRGQPVCRVGHRARRRHGRRHRRLQLGGQQRQRQPDVRPEPGQPDRCRERGHQPRRRWHRPRRRHPDLRRHQPAAGPQHQHQHGPDHRHHRLHRRRRQPVCRQHHGDRQPADGRRDRHVHVDRDQRQSRADVRPGRPQPDGSRRHPRQSRRWRHRSRRRHPDLRRHQPAAGPVDQHHHRAHHGDHRVHRLGHPVQRVGDGPRRGHGRRDGHLHVDRDQRQPRTDIRPGRARPEPCRGRRHQPRRGRHRSRRRHADLRRHQPAAGSVHQHQHGPDHRHHRVHRRRGQPVCRVGHRARRRHGRRHRRLQLGGQRCGGRRGSGPPRVQLRLQQRIDHEHHAEPASWHRRWRRDADLAERSWHIDRDGTCRLGAHPDRHLRLQPAYALVLAPRDGLRPGHLDVDLLRLPPCRRRDPRVQRGQHDDADRRVRRSGCGHHVGDRHRTVDHDDREQHAVGRVLRQHVQFDVDSARGLRRTRRPDRDVAIAVHLAGVGRHLAPDGRCHRGGLGHGDGLVGQRGASHRPAPCGRWPTACQQRADVRPERPGPDPR